MDSPGKTPDSVLSSNDENPRVKFLCSFSGSILPRPQDGKLRYVGGETRIVSVPRDITYEDLMSKMRELFEGATVLKYQQPDEDLDALVSVVNDDDVTNMMEEYDKLGSGDGFTRLRIFLFSSTDQDGSLHFVDGDEREHERRYVDALNSLNDSPEFLTHPLGSPVIGSFEDVRVAEQYFNQMNLEGSLHGQRNMELPMAQMNLRHLTIPRSNAQIPVTQRYNEMEAPWSPAYYSPRQPESVSQRPVVEFPTSPSSCRYRTPYADFSDKSSEDYVRPPMNPHSVYEQLQHQYTDNVVLLPSGPVESAGFPGNILQGPPPLGVYEGNNICNNCRMTFNRTPPVFEPSSVGNGFPHVPCVSADCPPSRGIYVVNSDPNIHPSYYNRDHSDREWILPHQMNQLAEESRMHAGRLPPENYVMENGVSVPIGHANVFDGPHMQSDYGSQVFQEQAVATGPGPHIYTPPPAMEERGVRYGNSSYAYGAADNLYQAPHSHNIPSQSMWRNVHGQVQAVPHYEMSIPPMAVNGSMNTGFVRGAVEDGSRGPHNQWAESLKKPVGFNGPEQAHNQTLMLIHNTQTLANNHPHIVGPVQSTVPDPMLITAASVVDPKIDDETSKLLNVIENGVYEENKETNQVNKDFGACGVIDKNSDALAPSLPITLNVPEPSAVNGSVAEDSKATTDDKLEFLPELIASAKEAAVQNMNEVKAKVQEGIACSHEDNNLVAIEGAQDDPNEVDDHVELEVDVDNEHVSNPKIEPTKAEAEAIDRGLQTIRNEDLEEIRELGSGTYGSVYHGKWKGSDVAIKRIKASCFAGKPSERERLIADFWKEAQILSSLHHPNVVAFYGVVRDGPDGSLATVTEFMVNGSLKQFLQKKDRTIDRRKRLLIAMDTAFGMEYLHGKNIVHFDLKCENLLVNMRDPHRPVCKIGDLGLSKVKQHTLVSGGVRGTLPWMAPELLSGKSNMVTEKIDVYSFGIVMWELLTGDEPYADMHCASIIGGIVNNTLRPQIPAWCDPEWKALMESCWASDPAQRPSFSEISQKLRNMAAAMNLK